MTSTSLFHTFYFAALFLLLFASAEVLYRIFKLKAEITRKYVHVATGIITLLFPSFIANHWLVLALCTSFLLILIVSLRFGLLPSINKVSRTTYGSILYPIVVYICYLTSDKAGDTLYFFLPILILAICDPMAALIGKNYPFMRYHFMGYTKTLSGSLAFFITATLISGGFLCAYRSLFLWEIMFFSVLIALTATIAEAISHKGFDNLTIPLSVLFTLYFINQFFQI